MEKIAFFCFLWTSSGKIYTLNFKNATRKCENRQTSENALLVFSLPNAVLGRVWFLQVEVDFKATKGDAYLVFGKFCP